MRRRLIGASCNSKPGVKTSPTAAGESGMPLGLESIAQIKWAAPGPRSRESSDTQAR